MQTNRRGSISDTIDISKTKAKSFPKVKQPDTVISIDASQNFIQFFPNLEDFTSLQHLNLAKNELTDLSNLGEILHLKFLDISNNHITSIEFIEKLPNLEMLNASSNEIQSISCAFPPHLLELDLSNNQLSSLDFLENEEKVPVDLEQLNVSGNKIRDLIELRFISPIPKLRFLNIGLLKQEQSNQILEFVKHLCPSLEFFDDADCFDFDGNDFKEDELLPILIGGSEQRLQKYLFSSDIIVSWDKPYFIPFNDANISDSAEKVKKLENQINTIERRAQDTDSYEQLRDEIATLREQMSKLAELLFVHDQALREIWNK